MTSTSLILPKSTPLNDSNMIMNNNGYVTEVNLSSTTHDTLVLYRGNVYTCIMLVFTQNELIQHNNYMCMDPCQSLH